MNNPRTKTHWQIFNFFLVLAITAGFLFAWQNIAQLQNRSETPKIEAKQNFPVSIRAKQRGFPHINFKDGRNLMPLQADAVQGASPKILASADFDSDGIADLVTADAGGTLKLYRGKRDLLHPSAYKSGPETFPDSPFDPAEKSFSLNVSPDYLETGDFNADGKQDVLASEKGGTGLQFLAGDGQANFAEASAVHVDGQIAFMAAAEIGKQDGQADVVIAVNNSKGSFLHVFEHPESAFKHQPEIFKLDSSAASVAIGHLDDDFYADIAVASGNELTIIHGRGQAYPWDLDKRFGIERPKAVVAKRQMPFAIADLEIGDFNDARGDDLVILTNSGSLFVLEPARSGKASNLSLNGEARRQTKRVLIAPTGMDANKYTVPADSQIISSKAAKESGLPLIDSRLSPKERRDFLTKRVKEEAKKLEKLSKEELAERSAEAKAKGDENRQRSKEAFLKTISGRPATLAKWKLVNLVTDARLINAANAEISQKLIKARVSDSGKDDLILLDSISKQIQIVAETKTKDQSPKIEIVSLDAETNPVSVLKMRLNADSLDDLVVLRKGSPQPSFLMTGPAATIVVNTTSDGTSDCRTAGADCTLRGAIQLANASPGADQINFNIPGIGPHKIQPLSELPAITQTVNIFGGSQPGATLGQGIEIDGSLIGQPADGLKIRANSCFVTYLSITNFVAATDPDTGSKIGGNGISLETPVGSTRTRFNSLFHNFLGVAPDGTTAQGNQATGLLLFDSDSNLIENNVMSGNDGAGISVINGNDNTIRANKIGVNAAGTEKLPNSSGIFLTGHNNQIGGTSTGSGNTISGNGRQRQPPNEDTCSGSGISVEILFSADGSEFLTGINNIYGNKIGTNSDGTAPLGNCSQGITTNPITTTTIGSITEAGRNIVSDNGYDAIHCSSNFFAPEAAVGYCSISGNNIGTDITGTVSMSNDWRNAPNGQVYSSSVVYVFNNGSLSNVGAPGGTTPGGACSGFCNLISGNDSQNNGADGAVGRYGFGLVAVSNNFVGTNKNGMEALPNALNGIFATNNDTYIGGYDIEQNVNFGNLISGNTSAGIYHTQGLIFFDATFYIESNLVGIDTTGGAAIPNGPDNIGAVSALAFPNATVNIGGNDPFSKNYISGNSINGIFASGIGGQINIINNHIGVGKNNQPLGNSKNGIIVENNNTIIGGTNAGEGNVIHNNTLAGVAVQTFEGAGGSSNSAFNPIRGNSVRNNGGLGIDLTISTFFNAPPDGVTFNDDCNQDADSGPNLRQNFPVLTAPVFNQDETVTVAGTIRSTARQIFTIDVYSNAVSDPTGHGEGENYLGATSVTTDGNGFGSFTFTSTAQVPNTIKISATTNDAFGNTSEFSCNAGETCADSPLSGNFKAVEELTAAAAEVCPAAIVVNIITDEPDANTSDQVCDVNTSNTGLQCSLRAAIQEAEARPGTNRIHFDIPGGGVQTIAPTSALPDITSPVIIDATTQPGFTNRPVIELSGASAPPDTMALQIRTSDSTIRGFYVNRFKAGFHIRDSAFNNRVDTCYFGTGANFPDPVGTPMTYGVLVNLTAHENFIGGTTETSQNHFIKTGYGLIIGSNNNRVVGNIFINNYTGVTISLGKYNKIGANDGEYPNLFLGNVFAGIWLGDGEPPLPESRTIGEFLRKSGKSEAEIKVRLDLMRPHLEHFASVSGYSFPNIAKLQPEAPTAADTTGNEIFGNLIGTNHQDAATTGNINGIYIERAESNTIGGTTAVKRNYISANKDDGIFISPQGKRNFIGENFIGLTKDGQGALGNKNGIVIQGNENIVEKNYVSANRENGIWITAPAGSSLPENNKLRNNRIGVKFNNHASALGNGKIGIFIQGINNEIGDLDPTKGPNLVSGNHEHGIAIAPGSTGNVVQNNRIGTNSNGSAAVGNTKFGIFVAGSNNTIGGTAQYSGNIVSGNGAGIGVGKISGSSAEDAKDNKIQGNYIGLNFDGTSKIPNTSAGIELLNGANNNLIGGTVAGAGNVVSGNGKQGIGVLGGGEFGASPFENKIQGNLIGTSKTGISSLSNGTSGIYILNSSKNLIGGFGADIPLARNVISGNGLSGIQISGADSFQNRISGNYIGTQINGVSALANKFSGVYIFNGAHNNIIGGTEPNAGNTIKFNIGNGVYMRADAGTGNNVDPNVIFENTLLGIQLDGSGITYPNNISEATTPPSGQRLPNDVSDTDAGPNNLQNYPEIISTQIVGDELIINFKVDSAPANSNYGTNGLYVEFFKADNSGEGEKYLGFSYYTLADYNSSTPPGVKQVNLGDINALSFTADDKITSTTTDADGNTSEFSPINGFSTGLEADVATRPGGNNSVNAGDITQVQRFAVGLDQPFQSNEFQRADCAPRLDTDNTTLLLGNGAINTGDVTQAQRYAVGLDGAPPAAGGPTSAGGAKSALSFKRKGTGNDFKLGRDIVYFSDSAEAVQATYEVRAIRESLKTTTLTVAIRLDTEAYASAQAVSVGGTLRFDQTKLPNPTNIRLGSGAPAGTSFFANTSDVVNGRLGFTINAPVNQTFPIGEQNLLLIDFTVTGTGTATLSFDDSQAQRFVGEVNGNELTNSEFPPTKISLSPTAATATASGKITISKGFGINRAQIILTDSRSRKRFALTNLFGYFHFEEAAAGETYIFEVKSNGYQFADNPRVLFVGEDQTNLNFSALP